MRVQTISSVVPSPDGNWVAWAQSKAILVGERSENESQIWIAKADGSTRLQLTRGSKPSANPAWSPDGKWVYFTSKRSGKNDIFRIRVSGGEAEQLSKVKGEVGIFAISKDGRSVAYTSHEPNPEVEIAIKEKRDFHIVDTNSKNARLYVIAAEADPQGERKPRVLSPEDRHVQEAGWSPDGAKIAFTYWTTPLVNHWRKSRLAEADVASGAVKELALVGVYSGWPSYSSDGRFIAFAQTLPKIGNPGSSRVALYDRNAGSIRQLAATYNEAPRLVGWKPGNHSLIASESKGTTTAVLEIPVDGPVKELFVPEEGILTGLRMNDAANVFAVVHEASSVAPEAYVLDPPSKRLTQVSAANSDLPKLPLGKTEAVRWKSKDGMEIEGLLTYPVDYQPGTKAPLVLNLHGGPGGNFYEEFIGKGQLYPIATFAAKGFAVLRPNPRGSTGYGTKFRYANFADWGGMDYEDDQSGVDSLIAKGIVDPDRMAIMGWSYGGYSTSWAIGQTTRYKAAAVGAGVTNLLSFAGTTDIFDFLPDYFGGEFWEKHEIYWQRSPVSHAGKVKTPTLVLHGEADERVPYSQGFEFYNAIRRHGVPTEMVGYPRTPHIPQEPKFVLDIMQRHVSWVERYVHRGVKSEK
jgi:dipeptidyl aminopeptidase/acylaminoacyl peptidase